MTLFSRLLATAALGAALAATGAQAATLTGTLTADNEYNAYLSTNDAVLGDLVATGANWTVAQSFNANLAPGQTYYLHVVANNWYGISNMNGGNPDAFLGSFSLSGAGFTFANGLQTLNTDTTNWRVIPHAYQPLNAVNDWTVPNQTPDQWSTNAGPNIWTVNSGGPIAGIAPEAGWIWSHEDPGGEAMFSTTISALSVPEPATWGLMIVGFGGVGAVLRRRRHVAAFA